jgi:hypothetical protein
MPEKQFSVIVPETDYDKARVQALKAKKSLRVFCGELISGILNPRKPKKP